MKKIFTLLVMALMAVGVNAQETLDIEGLPVTFDSWSANFLIPKTDVNAGDKFLFVCETVEVDGWQWGPQLLPKSNADWSNLGDAVIPNAEGIGTFEITEEAATVINGNGGLRVQGIGVKVTAVQYVSALEYGEGKSIQFDEYGSILASEFAGYSDDAKVEFTIAVTGEATNADGSILGWGIGSLKSLDGSVDLGTLNLKGVGDNVFSFTVAQLKSALEAPADQYNRQGLSWSVWNQGNANCSRKSVTIYEVKSDESTTVIGNEDNSNGWWEAFSEYYTIPANNTLHLEFTNYSDCVNNWDNFVVVLSNKERGADGYAEYFVVRADNYGWGTCYDENTRSNNWNWEAFTTILNGSYVKLDVKRNEGNVEVYADVLGSDGNSYFQKYTMDIKEATADVVAFLTVEKGHLVLDNSKTAITASVPTNIEAPKSVDLKQAVRYNLAGQQVTEAYKGVVIMNGRKIVVK